MGSVLDGPAPATVVVGDVPGPRELVGVVRASAVGVVGSGPGRGLRALVLEETEGHPGCRKGILNGTHTISVASDTSRLPAVRRSSSPARRPAAVALQGFEDDLLDRFGQLGLPVDDVLVGVDQRRAMLSHGVGALTC